MAVYKMEKKNNNKYMCLHERRKNMYKMNILNLLSIFSVIPIH